MENSKEKPLNGPRFSVIAAIGENRELGRENELIWHIPDDLKRFKGLTMGHPIIMGRKTHESIGRPLPDRTNIIVTRGNFSADACVVVHSFEDALQVAKDIDNEEVFVIGGASIYEALLSRADRLYLTLIHATDRSADVFFPKYSEFSKEISHETHTHDNLTYEYLILERER